MPKYLDYGGVSHFWSKIKTKFSVIGHTHTITPTTETVKVVNSAGSAPTLGTAFSVKGVDTITAGTAASLTTDTFSIPNLTGVGTLPSLTVSNKSIPNVTSAGTAASLTTETKTFLASATFNTVHTGYTVTNGNLTFSTGASGSSSNGTVDGVATWTANTPATLGTAISVGSASGWSAGTLPTTGTAFSVKGVKVFTANTPTSVTATDAMSIPNVTSVGSATTTTNKTVVTGVSATDASTN